jgi:hypothetical protein
LIEQREAERVLFDLIVAPFESLTPGSGGGSVVGEEGEACQRHLSGYGVLYAAGSFEIVLIKPETGEEGGKL